MGEINPDVAAGKARLILKPYTFSPAKPPAAVTCSARPGPAVFVNLAPGPKGSFSLILAPVTVLKDTTRKDMRVVVRTWIRPPCPVPEFLEKYSRAGGTHHSALVLGKKMEALAAFGRLAGLDVCTIGDEA